jgi:hypothetical protein
LEARREGVHAQQAGLRLRPDDDLVHVGREHAADALVAPAVNGVGQAGDALGRPAADGELVEQTVEPALLGRIDEVGARLMLCVYATDP